MAESATGIVPSVDNKHTWTPLALAPIQTAEEYTSVAEYLKQIAAYEKRVKAHYRGSDDAPGSLTLAYRTYDKLLQEEKEALAPAKADRETCDTMLVDYDDRQIAIAAEKQRLADAQALKDAETRQIAEAAALETLANDTFDGALMDEAEALLEQPVQADPVFVAKETPRVAGISIGNRWKANQSVWNHARDLKLLCAAYLGMRDPKVIAKLKVDAALMNFLMPNWVALNQQAKATSGTANIPGVAFFNDRGVSARSK